MFISISSQETKAVGGHHKGSRLTGFTNEGLEEHADKRLTMKMTHRERLEAGHIKIPESGCWLWEKATNVGGYGVTWDGTKQVYAHRLSWTLRNGAIPEDRELCHKCDTPSCINPEHLFLGTRKDNMQDASRKGRMRTGGNKGATNGRAKLTEEAVKEIRASSLSNKELALIFGVHFSRIGAVRRHETWKSITV